MMLKGYSGEEIFGAVVILIVIIIGVVALSNFSQKSDLCEKKGGILVKTGSGFVCIDRKTIK